MFGDDSIRESLRDHLNNSFTIETGTVVTSEWNMNVPGNILEVGNYRRRVTGNSYPADNEDFMRWVKDNGYTRNATDADVVIDGNMFDDEDMPALFLEQREKFKLLYSLDECFTRNRPRSGINKPLFLGYPAANASASQWLNNYGTHVAERPRYYMSSRFDPFKYWTSFRTQQGQEYGVSRLHNGKFIIEDTAPYVVYKNPVPANRIVIKMQTNVGTHNIGETRTWKDSETIEDPLYDNRFDENGEMVYPQQINATLPDNWRVELLVNSEWKSVASMDNTIIPTDGHFELVWNKNYDLPVDAIILGEKPSVDSLPNITAEQGDTWIVGSDIWYYNGSNWEEIVQAWTWEPAQAVPNHEVKAATNLMRNSEEFEYIKGIRIVVEEMVRDNITFDLIELSPRLVANISDRVNTFNISKSISDLGTTTIPVGSLRASTGTVVVNNNDGVFTDLNENSAIGPYLRSNVKFKFYDIVKNVDVEYKDDLDQTLTYKDDIVIPIKTMYSETYPASDGNFDSLTFNLRDKYSFLEATQAPELFLTDVSLSYAVVMLLDYIGFSNVKFYRAPDEKELVIPFFFVPKGKNVAEILSQLATASQSAMWFDEYNNLCVGSRGWLFPEGWEDISRQNVLRGNSDENYENLPNIINLTSDEKRVSNDGSINYNERYIERQYSSMDQAYDTAAGKSWAYKPSLLWEISGKQSLREAQGAAQSTSAALTAVPLATDITIDVPVWEGSIKNQYIDLGENVNWLGSNNGYFYANGEIIKFDAMEYAVTGIGNVWVETLEDYQSYISDLPFNGKIYPTGRIRIFTELEYNDEGNPIAVKSHGRGQFGTEITQHKAGLDEFWTSPDTLNGMKQKSDILFRSGDVRYYPKTMFPPGAISDTEAAENENAKNSTVNGVMKNIFADDYQVEQEINKFGSSKRQTVQASALSFEGPSSFPLEDDGKENPVNFISYLYKDFERTSTNDEGLTVREDYPYSHFGTRMKVIGDLLSQNNNKQIASGNNTYVSLQAEDEKDSIVLTGGSGGIGVGVDKSTNEGYFFEIVALSNDLTDKVSPNPAIPASATYKGSKATFDCVTSHTINVGDKVIVVPNSEADTPDGDVYSGCGVFKVESVDKENGILTVTGGSFGSYGSNSPRWKVQKLGQNTGNMNNLLFYKMLQDDATGDLIPFVLWEGIADIIVDMGIFTDIQRKVGDSISSVYDLAVEWEQSPGYDSEGRPYPKTFHLYINDKQVATVTDKYPYRSQKNTVALFTRGRSKVMFNNVYALCDRIADSTVTPSVGAPSSIFGVEESISNAEVLNKYGISGLVQQRYLQGINIEGGPSVRMWFDEFGTIMRECQYVKAVYDTSFPALTAKLVPYFNSNRAYITSQFMPGCYGAEFLIFNTTDTVLSLTADSGNFVRILGVGFTQDMAKNLTVDDYYNSVADLSNPPSIDALGYSPYDYDKQWQKIKDSRYVYDKREFQAIQSDYIQEKTVAQSLLGWITSKTLQPKQLIGVNAFATNNYQLGDIVSLDYKVTPTDSIASIDAVANSDKKFIVYQIDFNKGANAVQNTLYLVEV